MDKKNFIVIPGELLSEDVRRAGNGTYIENNKVYSSIYGLANVRNKIRVQPLSGKYIPSPGDVVIGIITDITFSNWIVDINSPYEGLLHVSEYPRKIEYEDLSKYIRIGELILVKVKDVNSTMKIELTLRDRDLRILRGGRVVEISYTKLPRVIGRNGSMISLLNRELNCNILVGQNGRIWIKGSDVDMSIAIKAIQKIEKEAHTPGLTNRITAFLKSAKNIKKGVEV
ncbi:MAG: exosome complex RNA-binding protein Rrp4 [Methanosarcinales archaeon]